VSNKRGGINRGKSAIYLLFARGKRRPGDKKKKSEETERSWRGGKKVGYQKKRDPYDSLTIKGAIHRRGKKRMEETSGRGFHKTESILEEEVRFFLTKP